MAQHELKAAIFACFQTCTGLFFVLIFWALMLSCSLGGAICPPDKTSEFIETCQLPAPAEFFAQSNGVGSLLMSWNTVAGAAGYQLTVHNLSTNEVVCDRVEYGSATTLSNLQTGVNYRCSLASKCSTASTSNFIIVVDVNI